MSVRSQNVFFYLMTKTPRNFFPSGTWLSCWILLSQHHSKCQYLIRWSLFPDLFPHFSITRHGEFGRWGGGKGSCTGSLRRELDWKWLLWSMIVAKLMREWGNPCSQLPYHPFPFSLPSAPHWAASHLTRALWLPWSCTCTAGKLLKYCELFGSFSAAFWLDGPNGREKIPCRASL